MAADEKPPEPPNLTALYWPNGEDSDLAIRDDATAVRLGHPDRRWWQPNNTSMRAETWPDLVEWMRVQGCPIGEAIRLAPERPATVANSIHITGISLDQSRADGFGAGLQIGYQEGRRHGR